ncbi:hypothetical protein K469DRAFT_684049 [Zopfia rhizophila CBS 207.26]|uniref:Uncharacterized protein n=1 Tax=Zopfia rhizophila CBS 207.26 TaxID=1314779 RepID=A0A6A6D885_9PEZI|nr:hypothetical protein K469DRAFT_684049 [Zopfia rhizophila CBS 207.26]
MALPTPFSTQISVDTPGEVLLAAISLLELNDRAGVMSHLPLLQPAIKPTLPTPSAFFTSVNTPVQSTPLAYTPSSGTNAGNNNVVDNGYHVGRRRGAKNKWPLTAQRERGLTTELLSSKEDKRLRGYLKALESVRIGKTYQRGNSINLLKNLYTAEEAKARAVKKFKDKLETLKNNNLLFRQYTLGALDDIHNKTSYTSRIKRRCLRQRTTFT